MKTPSLDHLPSFRSFSGSHDGCCGVASLILRAMNLTLFDVLCFFLVVYVGVISVVDLFQAAYTFYHLIRFFTIRDRIHGLGDNCCICLTNTTTNNGARRSKTVFLLCGHCVGSDCFGQTHLRKCPLCNHVIRSNIKIAKSC